MLQFPIWKRVLIAAVCLLGILYALPNLTGRIDAGLPVWAPGAPLNLGLDLQGGAHLVYELDEDATMLDRLSDAEDAIRLALREERVRPRGMNVNERDQTLTFAVGDNSDIDAIREAVRNAEPELTIDVNNAGRFTLSIDPLLRQDILDRAISQSLVVVGRRVNELGLTEPTIQRQGQDRILIQVPGIDDTQTLKDIIGTTAKLTFHLVDRERSAQQARETGRVPPGLLLLPEATEEGAEPSRHYLVTRRVYVSGEDLTGAQATFQDSQPVVSFSFNPVGAQRFGRVTQENVGENLAIVLDNEVISAPVIRDAILGGNGIISGSFSLTEAQDLALLLRAGALPAPMTIVEERTVGPGLGQDSIDAGKLASLIGFLLVVVFMGMAYGRFGVMADVALIVNLILIMGILSALQATLTLPGIAGIVLTVGMAVDANVLIFERIREEQSLGRTPSNAVETGYKRALTTIVDSNLTTLIAAILLFVFGTGPIRGFAVTLSIGIMTSMFTAIMVTRFMVVTWLLRRRPKLLPL